jgi:ABC-2 type transport system permease protein
LLRVRALALEGQIYESDQPNPELALLGRLDYAFVIGFLVPLFVIVLLHDLVASERAAGRLSMLQATARGARLWTSRATVLLLALLTCVLLPLVAGAIAEGVPNGTFVRAVGVVIAQVAFWAALTVLFAFRPWPAPTIAAVLASIWLVTALVIPLVGKLAIERAVPGVSGAEIALRQREVVNAAWDLPRATTMAGFIARHPEWRDTAPVTAPFHWKWYYAFQQVGDQSVEELSAAYRDAVRRRDEMTEYVAWLSPTVAAQRMLQRLARTDTAASAAFEARVRAFHESVRKFWYPPIFNEEPFVRERLSGLPVYVAEDG